MKKLFIILLLLIPVYAYSLVVSGVDGGGNADTLEGQNGSFYLDIGNATGTFPVVSHSAFLSYEDDTGFFEDYSTADIFYKWQNNINDSRSFGNMSVSIPDASITILSGGAGEYWITRDTGTHGEPDVSYIYAIFNNDSATSETHTSHGTPLVADPFFTNLSSFSGGAAYNTNSSIGFLLHADKDVIKIIESGSGNGVGEWCFEYEVHFMIDHIPHVLRMSNIQYNGGSGHFTDALAFDNLSSRWDDLRTATADITNAGAQEDYKYENLGFEFANGGLQTRYILNGLVKIKLRHNDSVVCSNGHELWIDKLSLADKVGVRSDSATIIRRLADGDKITLQEKPEDGGRFFHRHKTRLIVTRIGD
ncbi:hypothetical protein KAR91_59200 [Candidatus Pacearchaeota archaeon]|nr:hypothetical protein [Candidatus Pacearchaeota archaeon]